MRAIGFVLALIGTCLFMAPNAAQAQATRTWISGVGDDVNPCSRTAPCKTFPGAISKTAAGGEIDTLDPGGFGAVTITKAITLANEGIGEAGILVAGTNGITINCATDPNCTVILRGLQIDGGPVGSNSLSGVKFVAGRTLIIQHCAIRNFTGTQPNGYGVSFTPSSGTASLYIDDSTIVTNGPLGGTSGGGVFIGPTGNPTVNVTISNTQISNNTAGVRADTTGMSGGSISVSIDKSEAAGNAFAGLAVVTAPTSSVTANLNVTRTVVAHNGFGLNANGSGAILRIGSSTVVNNATGVKQQNGAVMTSYGNNQISDNPIPGPTITVVGPT